MMKSFLFIIICLFDLNAQNIYYQKDFITSINNKEIEISVGKNNYKLYDGILSSDGNYAAGILIESSMIHYIKNLRSEKIIEYFDPIKINLVLYSFKENKIIYTIKSQQFPILSFLRNLLIINSPSSLDILDIYTGKIKHHIELNITDNIYINNNKLFYARVKNGQLALNKYFCSKNIFIKTKVNNIPRGYSIALIGKKNIYLTNDNYENRRIKILNSKGEITDCKLNIKFIHNANELTLIGKEPHGNYALFGYNEKLNKFEKYFELQDINKKFNLFIENFKYISKSGDKIYLIPEALLKEDENLYQYNIKEKLFIKLTEHGFISSPLGIISNKN